MSIEYSYANWCLSGCSICEQCRLLNIGLFTEGFTPFLFSKHHVHIQSDRNAKSPRQMTFMNLVIKPVFFFSLFSFVFVLINISPACSGLKQKQGDEGLTKGYRSKRQL